jgi:hypothetical protein
MCVFDLFFQQFHMVRFLPTQLRFQITCFKKYMHLFVLFCFVLFCFVLETFCNCSESDVTPLFVSEVKGKVVPVLLTEHHAVKAYWRVEV